MAYPTTIDSFTDQIDGEVILANDVNELQTAIEALEAKVGVDSSAVNTTSDFKLGEVTGGDKAVGKTATQTLTNKTLTSPKITVGSDAVGDLHYTSNADGTQSRLGKGNDNQILKMNGTALNWEDETVTVNASTTVAGIVEEATTAQINSETQTGETGADLFMNPSQFASSVYGIMAGFFGDGSDGDVTISGTTTLTKDMCYNNLTINSSQILNTANFRIFVKGTLTNNGTIRCNGADASGKTGGVAVVAGTMLGGGNGANAGGLGNAGGGGAGAGVVFICARTVAVQGTIEAKGGAGGNATSASSNTTGSNGTTISRSLIQTGTGGAGGASSGNAGGTGGVITTSSKMASGGPLLLPLMFDGVAQLAGGAGGASGGENGAAPDAGGGGGGQGGVVVFIYHKMTTSGTVTVAGGALGTKFNAGASDGVAGSSGLSISIQI